ARGARAGAVIAEGPHWPRQAAERHREFQAVARALQRQRAAGAPLGCGDRADGVGQPGSAVEGSGDAEIGRAREPGAGSGVGQVGGRRIGERVELPPGVTVQVAVAAATGAAARPITMAAAAAAPITARTCLIIMTAAPLGKSPSLVPKSTPAQA